MWSFKRGMSSWSRKASSSHSPRGGSLPRLLLVFLLLWWAGFVAAGGGHDHGSASRDSCPRHDDDQPGRQASTRCRATPYRSSGDRGGDTGRADKAGNAECLKAGWNGSGTCGSCTDRNLWGAVVIGGGIALAGVVVDRRIVFRGLGRVVQPVDGFDVVNEGLRGFVWVSPDGKTV